ncbi:MAG: efflux RND transporter periplasmic adaptor subunit [Vicinamibacterales bacterium]
MFQEQKQGRWRFSPLVVAGALMLGVALGAVLVMAVRQGGAPTPEENHASDLAPGVVELTEAAQRNAQVATVQPTVGELPVTLDVTGVVTPDSSRVAHIRPLARGLIEDVHVALGSRVQRGQPLVTYDNIALGELVSEFLAERAALEQARTDLEVRRTELQRAEELIKIEAIAQQTLDVRRAEFRNAEAAVASRTAQVARVEEQIHRFGLSDEDLSRLTPEENQAGHRVASHNVLRAPFSGIVTMREVAAGELVEPDRELFTITDLATVWVLADVYEKDLGRIAPGTDVTLRVGAYPERTFRGRLTYIGDAIDPQSRTAKVRCVVANPDGALKLEMFASVAIPTTERRQTMFVPTDAVQQIDGRSVVFVRQSATRFIRRDVALGVNAGDVQEILSGLEASDVVVSAGSFHLKTALLQERIGDEH